MNRLDRAILDFEDETLDLDMGERVCMLRTALTWAAYDRMKRIHKHGLKSEESKDLDFKQTECQKLFRIIENMYYSQLKQNKMLGKAQDEGMSGKEILEQIKKMKSSIGDIVAKIPVTINNQERDN